ncbi:MAG: N-acetylmannosamine-6-phosphate 2-epimerase [Vulcanimicrobiaceae bacterium]
MNVLDGLRAGLIVSVQAWPGSAIDDPHVIAAMAEAAIANGAAGVRIQGERHIRAVRARITAPIVGLIKRAYEGFEPYITPTDDEVRRLLACGADIIAFDATARQRPGRATVEGIVTTILDAGSIAMADCASAADALCAQAAGAQIVATTLCGYTAQSAGHRLPALDLVAEMRELEVFVICEGGIVSPSQAVAALDAGADAVVVGTAITNIDWLVREFSTPVDKRTKR